jgi:signal transduction histidine kinase
LTGRALVPIRAAFATERRFVAAASHELRTPAAIIRASAEVLQREGLVQDEGSSLVTGLVAEADRLSGLVVELLALSSSRADPDAVQLVPADLAEIVPEAVSRVRPLADERGCKLVLSTSPAPELPILGDVDRLLQLLVILLDNATRLAPPGTTVDVRLGRGDRLAWFSVDDHGPGVAVEDRLRIFEPFARAAAGRRQRREGSGLGLAVARSLVDRHHGTISVDDAPGGGARFTVSLPLR